MDQYRGIWLFCGICLILLMVATGCSAENVPEIKATETLPSMATVARPATEEALPTTRDGKATETAVFPSIETKQGTAVGTVDGATPETAVQKTPTQIEETSPAPQATPSPAAPASATADNGSNRSGGVVVQTDRLEYSAGEQIVVSVVNGLSTDITTLDQQAFCSIIRLEKQDGAAWQEVRNCYSGPPPVDIPIEAGATVSEIFPPGLDPGIYRVGLAYTIGSKYVAGESLMAYSQPFRVN